MHAVYFDCIHSPEYAPHLLNPCSGEAHLVLGMGPSPGPQLTYQRQYSWRKIGSPSPKSHQLTIVLQLGVGAHEPPPTLHWNVDWFDLVWSCAASHSHCEPVSASVLSCPKDTVYHNAFWLLGLTVFTPSSTMSLCLREGWEHSTETCSLHFDQL